MSKKREDWFDTVMTFGGGWAMAGVAMLAREMWMFMWIMEAMAVLHFAIAGVIKIGWKELIVLPQALWMAIQDRRKKYDMRTVQNDRGRCYGCRYCRTKGV